MAASFRSAGAYAVVVALVTAALGGCGRSEAATAQPPPDPEIEVIRARGRDLFFGRGGCVTCHRIGEAGIQIRCPNLGVGDGQRLPIGTRIRHEAAGDGSTERVREIAWGIEYIVESIVDPDGFVVPGYAAGVMKAFELPPIALTDDEILALATYLAGEGEAVPRVDRDALQRARSRIGLARAARQSRSASGR